MTVWNEVECRDARMRVTRLAFNDASDPIPQRHQHILYTTFTLAVYTLKMGSDSEMRQDTEALALSAKAKGKGVDRGNGEDTERDGNLPWWVSYVP